ncbi:hypothetical protein [Acetobacter cibinongensis]|uniref:Uncharacterized protein n=1 Tax=Acetobacter cibinongensis TaxID=146475 RepID=A0A1Z5YR43_9PROT|nr:hypothetical protein [Acetobacter cibinongensis]OUI98099.1 hypothetical protein HK14_01105 [Acetobacter cibinongensis]
MLKTDRVLTQKQCATGPVFGGNVAAGFAVKRGSIAAFCQDGTLVPAGSANTPSAIVAIGGICGHGQDNTGTSNTYGATTGPGPVDMLNGCWALPFDAAPTWADKGKPVYAVDDETVSLTEAPASGTARLQVGTLAGLETDGTPYVLIP